MSAGSCTKSVVQAAADPEHSGEDVEELDRDTEKIVHQPG
jgi:hypothetical protein